MKFLAHLLSARGSGGLVPPQHSVKAPPPRLSLYSPCCPQLVLPGWLYACPPRGWFVRSGTVWAGLTLRSDTARGFMSMPALGEGLALRPAQGRPSWCRLDVTQAWVLLGVTLFSTPRGTTSIAQSLSGWRVGPGSVSRDAFAEGPFVSWRFPGSGPSWLGHPQVYFHVLAEPLINQFLGKDSSADG